LNQLNSDCVEEKRRRHDPYERLKIMMKILWLMLGTFVAITGAWGAEKPEGPCVELRLRDARNELLAAAKRQGAELLPKWHLSKDWVTPPAGAADYFRKGGMDVFGEVDAKGGGSITATLSLSRDAKGEWEIGVLRHSRVLFRIFDSSEVRRFLRGYNQVDLSVSYGRCISGGFTTDHIEYSGFNIMITQMKGRVIYRTISVMLASGMGPIDNTFHYDRQGQTGKIVPGNGVIAIPPPKDTDMLDFPRLHDALTGKALPYLRLLR
jgi:hypothetical protein